MWVPRVVRSFFFESSRAPFLGVFFLLKVSRLGLRAHPPRTYAKIEHRNSSGPVSFRVGFETRQRTVVSFFFLTQQRAVFVGTDEAGFLLGSDIAPIVNWDAAA
nr:hypothetical protein [Pandoravirus aubagnensis]